MRVICGNDIAAAAKPGQAYSYGSDLIFQGWSVKQDASSNPIKDANGRMIGETLNTIFTMSIEKGIGEGYGGLRTGEWITSAIALTKVFPMRPQ